MLLRTGKLTLHLKNNLRGKDAENEMRNSSFQRYDSIETDREVEVTTIDTRKEKVVKKRKEI